MLLLCRPVLANLGAQSCKTRRFIIITASTISLLPIRRLASASKSDRTWRLVREPGWLEFILKHPKKATLVRK